MTDQLLVATENSASVPSVFISYSHDSPEHKEWVRSLATKLTENGVRVTLDLWDTKPGDDLGAFMHRAVRDSDRVIMVCTPKYVAKANDGQGGVGFEAMVVTSEIVIDTGTQKFIPLVRVRAEPSPMPSFMGYRYYVDFCSNDGQDQAFDQLLREIHQVPANPRPALGRSPFAVTPSGQGVPVSNLSTAQATMTPRLISAPEDFYMQACAVAAANDLPRWRMLVKAAKNKVNQTLETFPLITVPPPDRTDEAISNAIKFAEAFAPLFAVALGGSQSGRPDYRNHSSFLQDIVDPSVWPRAGLISMVNMPEIAGFAFQALMGASAMFTGQYRAARQLAATPVALRSAKVVRPLWKRRALVSCPPTIGQSTRSWTFLTKLFENWEWLQPVFHDNEEYLASLTAYYMLLNVDECAEYLSATDKQIENEARLDFDTSVQFLSVDENVGRQAYQYLIHNVNELRAPWDGNVESLIISNWATWTEKVRWAYAQQRNSFDPPDAPFDRLPMDLQSIPRLRIT